jgi:hypothetical protein
MLRKAAVGPDPIANVAGAVAVGGGRWLIGRLLDRLANRPPSLDPTQLPLAPSESAALSNNVRITEQ